MKLNEILQLKEQEQTIDASSDAIHEFTKECMLDLQDEFKGSEAKQGSVPSAPDSFKFRAIKYGMIQYCPKEYVHGSYGTGRQYDHFFKMGSNVASETRKEILDAFIEQFHVEFDLLLVKNRFTAFKTSDGKRVVFSPDEGGSAWGGFGLYIQ